MLLVRTAPRQRPDFAKRDAGSGDETLVASRDPRVHGGQFARSFELTMLVHPGAALSPAEHDRAISARRAAARVEVRPLGASEWDDWDAFVAAHRDGSLFHTTAWMRAVRRTFPHEPVYLAARDTGGGTIHGVLPMFAVRSRLAGPMMVSVPYAVYGGVLADDDGVATALLGAAVEEAHRRSIGFIDLRSRTARFADLPTVDRYVTFSRRMPARVEDVAGCLPRKARAAARNARCKYGLSVRFGDDLLGIVWDLYSRSMRRLGSINYPRSFLEALADETPGGHVVSVVYDQSRPIAGLMSFVHRDTVMPYFAGSTDAGRRVSANNYLYLTIMEWAVEHGFACFDFGRSRVDNAGSFHFKRFCGFEPEPLGYQYVSLNGRAAPNLAPSSARFRLARRIWPHLPLFLTRAVGARLAAHIPG